MADVTIVPPAQVQNITPAGGGSQQAAPPGVPAGSLISGTIAGKDASGNYLLKTSQGTFALQSSTPLTYNSDVTIRVGANAAGSTSARIVTVNGEPFSEFSTPDPATSDSVSETALTQAPEASAVATPPSGATVRATVVLAPAAETPAASATLAQGNAVTVRLAPTGNPATEPAAQATAPPETSSAITSSATVAEQPQEIAQNTQPAVATAAAQPATPNQPTSSAAPAAAAPAASAPAIETQLAPGEAVTQTPQAQQPQAQTPQTQTTQPQAQPAPATASAQYGVYAKQAAPPAATPSAPNTPAATGSTPAQTASIPAQVVSAGDDGTLTLQTALGNVTLKASSTQELSLFTPGASVTLEPPAPAQSAAPAPLTELAASWQSLKDIFSQVSETNPTAANALLSRMPQIGPEFVSTSTNFVSALLQGDIRKLLGDDVIDTLRDNGRQDLVEKFSAEAANLSGSFTAPQQRQVSGWQMLFLPFVFQEELQQARLYVKRDSGKKERASSKSQGDTRFVVEVDLSELGPMQMDGLVRKKDQATAFDLVIRSHHGFSRADQQEIAEIYTSAAQMTGFKGSLAFQVTRDFVVKPLDEAAGDTIHAITV